MEAGQLWNILNVVSVGLSIYAVCTAINAKAAAKKAAEAVVEKQNLQEDRERVRILLATIAAAKDAAMRRQRGAPKDLSVGQDPEHDLHTLRIAHDQLMTDVPHNLLDSIARGASEIQTAIQAIEKGSPVRDGWKDALSALQILISTLQHEERRQRDASLLRHVKND